jgi:DNA-binding response OmpR family regulator
MSKLIQQFNPDLVILDWMMPGLTGVELCRQLRAADSKIPAILLTARDDISDRLTGLAAGANDYLVKPFNIEDLLVCIHLHLELPLSSVFS